MSNRKLTIRRNRKSLHQAPHPVFVDLHFLKNRETKACYESNNKSNDDTTISKFRKIKFRYFEKATQFWKIISQFFWRYVKLIGRGFFSNFQAFSEYFNFNNVSWFLLFCFQYWCTKPCRILWWFVTISCLKLSKIDM